MIAYLAGYMNAEAKDKCVLWRNIVKSAYPAINWIDPCDGADWDNMGDGTMTRIHAQDIYNRDMRDVKMSDFVVANLDNFGQSRPPTGTISEIAWCGILNKHLIVISGNDCDWYHPFTSCPAARLFGSVAEMIDSNCIGFYSRTKKCV